MELAVLLGDWLACLACRSVQVSFIGIDAMRDFCSNALYLRFSFATVLAWKECRVCQSLSSELSGLRSREAVVNHK